MILKYGPIFSLTILFILFTVLLLTIEVNTIVFISIYSKSISMVTLARFALNFRFLTIITLAPPHFIERYLIYLVDYSILNPKVIIFLYLFVSYYIDVYFYFHSYHRMMVDVAEFSLINYNYYVSYQSCHLRGQRSILSRYFHSSIMRNHNCYGGVFDDDVSERYCG